MFWNKFKFLCDSRGVKPNKVCKDLGLSNAASTHWKNGKSPKFGTVQLIAVYFKVSTDYFKDDEEQQSGEIQVNLDCEAFDKSMFAITDAAASMSTIEAPEELSKKKPYERIMQSNAAAQHLSDSDKLFQDIYESLTDDQREKTLSFMKNMKDNPDVW